MDETFSLLFAIECLVLARLFYTRRQYPDAVRILKKLRNRCQKRGLKELVLQIDILSSAVLHALDRRKTAKLLLQKALLFSETEGYIRPFVNDAALIAPILKSIADEQPNAVPLDHLENIFSACNIPFKKAIVSHKFDNCICEDLTRREVEILEWIAQGLQNKEIARKEFVSINTIKCHVRNILSKLNVNTRGKAVSRAKEMKIL